MAALQIECHDQRGVELNQQHHQRAEALIHKSIAAKTESAVGHFPILFRLLLQGDMSETVYATPMQLHQCDDQSPRFCCYS